MAAKLCGCVKIKFVGGVETFLGGIKKIILSSVNKIILNGVIVIMLGCVIEIMLGSIVGTGTPILYPRQCVEKMHKNTFSKAFTNNSSGEVRQICSVRSFFYK